MIVRLLGTSAADGIPAFFADDRVSRHARKHGGKDVRTRAAAVVDGQLKLDFGPDTFMQALRDKLDPRDWIAVVYTHSDADHFSSRELQYGLFPFTSDFLSTYAVYANETICNLIEERYPDWPIEVHRSRSFEPFRIAEYEITPIAANHSPNEDCQNIIVDDGSSRLLYATDTGLWNDPTWKFLACMAPLDALVIECTNGGVRNDYWGHLNVESCIGVVKALRDMGALKPNARVVTTHHSHEGGMLHSELAVALAPHGIEPGFDGYEFAV